MVKAYVGFFSYLLKIVIMVKAYVGFFCSYLHKIFIMAAA
jgi:hypothetical protein